MRLIRATVAKGMHVQKRSPLTGGSPGSLTIKDVEQQTLPANGYFEKCIPVTPNEQTTSKFDLEFVVTDPAKAEFAKDLGNGYSVVLKASRLVH